MPKRSINQFFFLVKTFENTENISIRNKRNSRLATTNDFSELIALGADFAVYFCLDEWVSPRLKKKLDDVSI
jgi:hypothetical protein